MRLMWVTPNEASLPFVNAAPNSRGYSEETRKVIRSHVMLGKNRGKKLRTHATREIKSSAASNRDANIQRAPFDNRDENAVIPIPARVGSEVTFTEFPNEVGLQMLDAIQTLNTTIVRSTRLFSHEETWWCEPLHGDMVALHFTVFLAKGYQSHMRTGSTDQAVLSHYVKTLALLQRRVANPRDERQTSDRTMEVVIGLARVAAFNDEEGVAKKHLDGLYRMVTMRGGVQAISRSLLFKICYADVGVAMSTGQNTVFFSNNTACDSSMAAPWRSFYRTSTPESRHQPDSPSSLATFLYALDTRLHTVYDCIIELAYAANLLSLRNPNKNAYQVPEDVYPIPRSWNIMTETGRHHQETMVATLYRLVNLDLGTDTVNEAMRLGLLAFASSIFAQWRGFRPRYPYIARSLLLALNALSSVEHQVPREVMLWLYVVGSISGFNEEERRAVRPALLRVLGELQLQSWEETKAVLRNAVWIDAMQDPVAERVLVPQLFPKISQTPHMASLYARPHSIEHH